MVTLDMVVAAVEVEVEEVNVHWVKKKKIMKRRRNKMIMMMVVVVMMKPDSRDQGSRVVLHVVFEDGRGMMVVGWMV